MHKAITLLFVFTLFGAGCSSTATPPSSAPAKGAPAPARPQEPVAKVTAVPQSAPAIGQAIAVPGGAIPAENPLLGRRKDGRPVLLAEYRGRAVLVNFWSSRCPPCAGELTTIEELRRQFEKKGLVVLAVNFGEKTVDADRFLAQQRLPLQMTQLLDPDRGAARGLGVRAVPTTLLFDAQGRLVSRYGGYTGLDAAQLRRELDQLLAAGARRG